MPDGSGGFSFLQILDQEGLLKAVWGGIIAIFLFFFKEIYYAPSKFVSVNTFDKWKDKDFIDKIDDLKDDIEENKEGLKEFADKQEIRDNLMYSKIETRDNEIRKLIVLSMGKGDKK